MISFNRKKQNGTTMLFLLVFVVGLFLAIALATDSGNWMLNKTRLQNALDATALSAAIALNEDPTRDLNNAISKGLETFRLFRNSQGNGTLSTVSDAELTFQFSRLITPFQPLNPGETAAYVRVSTNALQVEPILIQILEAFEGPEQVYGVSTAGFAPEECQLVPLVICPVPGIPERKEGCYENIYLDESSGEYVQGDEDICKTQTCESGCNGLSFNTRVCLKGGTEDAKNETCQLSSEDTGLPTGNFGLLRFDGMSGGDDIRSLLEGSVNICSQGATWENGNKVGPVSQGIDFRVDEDVMTKEYIPDYSTYEPGDPTNFYTQYTQDDDDDTHPDYNADGIPLYRVVQVPVAEDCLSETVEWGGDAACFFLTEKPKQHGGSNEVYGELTDYCPTSGDVDPNNVVLGGPTKVVLFKSENSRDS